MVDQNTWHADAESERQGRLCRKKRHEKIMNGRAKPKIEQMRSLKIRARSTTVTLHIQHTMSDDMAVVLLYTLAETPPERSSPHPLRMCLSLDLPACPSCCNDRPNECSHPTRNSMHAQRSCNLKSRCALMERAPSSQFGAARNSSAWAAASHPSRLQTCRDAAQHPLQDAAGATSPPRTRCQ